MKRPVKCISIDLALPTNRVRRCVPPRPAITPRLISGCPNFAVSDAMIKSHIIASSHPPPKAYPDTAAIIGLRVFMKRSVCAPKKFCLYISTNVLSAISLMSAPAANALSDPIRMMQRTLSDASASSTAEDNSSNSWELSAFKASGRFSVINATPSEISTMIVS